MTTSYELIDGRPALRFERRVAHPVTAVWSALTEDTELVRWFPSTITGELRPGGRLSFSFPEHPDVPDMDGDVTAFDPPSELGFFWGEDHLRFELEPAAEGAETDLRFTVLLGTADKAARDGAGWHTCLARLEASLDGADDGALKALDGGWREHYEEYARRGFPAAAPIPESAA
jgi:uncharacterized protein YndB with AHSA1/START domain